MDVAVRGLLQHTHVGFARFRHVHFPEHSLHEIA
jgi:hypothetical protein